MNNAFPTNTGGKSDKDYAEQQDLNVKNTLEQEKQSKAEKLDSYMSQKIDTQLAPIVANLQEHASKIDQILAILQQAEAQSVNQTAPSAPTTDQPQQQQKPKITDLRNLPPDVQAGLLDGVANIIGAIRGSGGPKDDYFGEMSKKITMNMLQAGVDGIMQNVYQNYKAVPPRNATSPQPEFSGDHKIQ